MDRETGNRMIPYNKMSLTGRGQVTTAPDVAVVRLGIQSTGENLEEVQTENAARSQELLGAIRQLGISEIKTFQYTIEKLYSYENDVRMEKGYTVRNIYEIRMNNIVQAGTVIDTAVAHGANEVDFISFEVSNPQYFYEQALNLAVMDAMDKAQSIASKLRVSLNPIPIHITENSSVPVPFSAAYSMREGVVATPIEPGQYQVEATVTAEFLY